MFNYTPEKKLLKRLLKAEKKPFNSFVGSREEYRIACSLFNGNQERTAFMNFWSKTNFTSKVKVDFVPVNGILFPVKYFECKRDLI